MENIVVQLSILDPLYTLFGWLTRELFAFFGNYGLAIIALTVIIRGLLIPLNIKSQKSMLKMQALSGKQAELQRKFGDDKQKYQEALMELQKENGAGGVSGCLLPFLQLFFIWPIYRIVSGPLVYLSHISKATVQSMIDLASTEGLIGKTVTTTNHIGLMQVLNNNAAFLKECVDKGFITMGQMIDLHFMGLDLTLVPWNVMKQNFLDVRAYLPLLVMPLLILITNIVSMQLTKYMKPGYKQEQEAKKRAKENPAITGQTADDPTQQTMKMMNWMMPLLMLYTSFTLPTAMALYWIVGGIMGIITQLLVYVLFTKPYELKKAEIEAKKEAVFKKSSKTDSSMGASGEGDAEKKGKNRRNGNNRKNNSKKHGGNDIE